MTQDIETPCPPHTHSSAGSTKEQECSCVAGFHGPSFDCQHCLVNTYCPGGQNYSSCPSNSTTHGLTHRNSSEDCVCLPGYFQNPVGLCEPCPVDSFCFNDIKYACPANASSRRGVDECTCDYGFRPNEAMSSSLVCQECPRSSICPAGGGVIVTCGQGAWNVYDACVCTAGSFCQSTGVGSLLEPAWESCQDPATCRPCPENMYCTNNSMNTCPDLSSSPENSSSVLDCVCLVGHYRSNHTCIPCPQGSYCQNEDRILCTEFDTDLIGTTTMAITRNETCVCRQGYFRTSVTDTCKPCPLDFFCPLASPDDMLPNVFACMQYGYTTEPGRWNFAQCYCEAGLKFSAQGLARVCLPCASGERCQDGEVVEELCHLENRIANADHSACVCMPGFAQDATYKCQECLPGEVKPEPGDGGCTLCPANTSSLNTTHCGDCLLFAHASAGSSECFCDHPREFDRDSQECLLCTVDHYFPDEFEPYNGDGYYPAYTGSCVECPANSTTRQRTGAVGIDTCLCDEGYVRGTEHFCEACRAGTYEKEGQCVQCGEGAHSGIASVNSSACTCNTSRCQVMLWTGNCTGTCEESPDPCSACERGWYKPTWSAVGNTEECVACPVNTYQPNNTSLVCVACDSTRQSPHTQAVSVDTCTCRPGYEPASSNAEDPCTPCALGYHKLGSGNHNCLKCSLGSFSSVSGSTGCSSCADDNGGISGATTTVDEGATSRYNCTCLSGHFLHNATCLMCASGTYKSRSGFHACDLCGLEPTQNKYGQPEQGAQSHLHCIACPSFQELRREF